MHTSRRRMLICVALFAWLFSADGGAQENPAAWGDEEKIDFLLNAEIVSKKRLRTGITGTQRATLRLGGIEHDAHIQTIDEFKLRFDGARGVEVNFRDSYKFNIAAYRLDRLVNLHYVPASVERRVGGEPASVTWWVDDVLMMEIERYRKKIDPPNKEAWNDQMYNVRMFNELVYNTDANLGNILITRNWSIRLVDFSRAFRIHRKVRDRKNLEPHIDERLYAGLKNLTLEAATRELSDVLTKSEIRGLIARRDELVEYFDAAIAERGRDAVVCSKPGH